jgi:hypothetical protein
MALGSSAAPLDLSLEVRYVERVVGERTVVSIALAMLCASSLLGASKTALAQSASSERVVARDLGYSGVEAYQAGKYALASERLEKAYAVLRAPSLGLWAARALAKQGRLLAAVDRYAEVTRLEISGGDEAVQRKALVDAQVELEQLRAQLPGAVIVVRGAVAAEFSLFIDGRQVSSQLAGELTPLDPGEHRIAIKAKGHELSRTLVLAQGEKQQVAFEVPGAAAPAGATKPRARSSRQTTPPNNDANEHRPGSLRKTLGWVSLSVGAAGLATGAITGAVVLSKQSKLDRDPGCADKSCPPELEGDVSSYNLFRAVSTTAFIAGGVFAAAGVTLVLTAPNAETSRTALRLSPTSVDLEYSF